MGPPILDPVGSPNVVQPIGQALHNDHVEASASQAVAPQPDLAQALANLTKMVQNIGKAVTVLQRNDTLNTSTKVEGHHKPSLVPDILDAPEKLVDDTVEEEIVFPVRKEDPW